MDGRRTSATAGVALLVTCLVVASLLLMVGSDPGSGTATNFQPVDDIPSLVVGAHHAKPVPPSGAALLAALLAAVVVLALGPVFVTAPTATWRRTFDLDDERFPRQLVSWAARAWRAPPLHLPA